MRGPFRSPGSSIIVINKPEMKFVDLAQYIKEYKKRSLKILEEISEQQVAVLGEKLTRTIEEDRQIFLCGNGGSASTASHFANDLGKGASFGKVRRFRVVSLVDNVAWMTALANDTDYSKIFVEQLKNYARPGDLLIAFSGSGNSANVVEVVEWAHRRGLQTVGITGRPGGRLAQAAESVVFVESSHMGHIEEGHFLIQHLLGYYFMECYSNAEEEQE